MTQEELKKLIRYDPETGEFISLKNGFCSGKSIGGLRDGYVCITLCGVRYRRSHLAWLYVYGEFPRNQIDHINRVKSDDRIKNLREATNSENMQNRIKALKNSQTGILGVSPCYGNKFSANIQVNGRAIRLGTFKTKEEAHVARLEGEKKYHPFKPKD